MSDNTFSDCFKYVNSETKGPSIEICTGRVGGKPYFNLYSSNDKTEINPELMYLFALSKDHKSKNSNVPTEDYGLLNKMNLIDGNKQITVKGRELVTFITENPNTSMESYVSKLETEYELICNQTTQVTKKEKPSDFLLDKSDWTDLRLKLLFNMYNIHKKNGYRNIETNIFSGITYNESLGVTKREDQKTLMGLTLNQLVHFKLIKPHNKSDSIYIITPKGKKCLESNFIISDSNNNNKKSRKKQPEISDDWLKSKIINFLTQTNKPYQYAPQLTNKLSLGDDADKIIKYLVDEKILCVNSDSYFNRYTLNPKTSQI